MSWIEDYEMKHKKLPELPDHLLGQVNKYSKGEPISLDVKMLIPSGQCWSNMTPTEQQEWRELVEWVGQSPDDLLKQMRKMLPTNEPKRNVL